MREKEAVGSISHDILRMRAKILNELARPSGEQNVQNCTLRNGMGVPAVQNLAQQEEYHG